MQVLTKNQTGPYPAYFSRYISQLPDTDVFPMMDQQAEALQNLLQGLTEEEALYAYGPGKWSIKEVMGHLIDTERIFAYRSLCISRQESQSLPGFDENAYVQQANFNQRTLASLLDEYKLMRLSHLALFRGMSPAMLERTGLVNNNLVSAQALIIISAAHERHHLNILRERYGLGLE